MPIAPLDIQPADALVGSKTANWGVFGPNGSGKSTLVASTPATVPTLVVSTGVENIKPYVGKPHIRVVKLTQWDQLLTILMMFRQKYLDHGKEIPDMCDFSKPATWFRQVAFDTWSGMQRLALNKIIGYDPFANEANFAQLIVQAPKTPKGYEAWQQAAALSNEWMAYFQALPVHKIFLFQQATREPVVPGEPHLTGPALTKGAIAGAREQVELMGKLFSTTKPTDNKTMLTELPEEVRAIDVHAVEQRYLLVGQHEAYATKGPTHILGYAVEDPSWDKLAVSLG